MEWALYSLIFIYIGGMVIDATITGSYQRKAMVIITDGPDAIGAQVLNRLHRGGTFLEGTGAYTGTSKSREGVVC